jgi:hypothetical protein
MMISYLKADSLISLFKILKMTKQKDVNYIQNGILRYGVYPALVYLKKLQEEEEYENCQVLLKAIQSVNENHKTGLGTEVDDRALDETYNNILKDVNNPELLNKNMPSYITDFENYMNK